MAENKSKDNSVTRQQGLSTNPEQMWNDLKTAIKAGNLTDVQSLLQQWRSSSTLPGPTSQDINYLVPRAAEDDGQPAILKYLLSEGGEIDTYTLGQTTSPAIFEIFLDHGWKPDTSILSSHITHPNLVSLFLSHGVDITTPTSARGFYPLDTACAKAPVQVVKLLLSNGAPVKPDSRAMNAAAQSDLPDRIEVMELLVSYGADINALAADYPAPSEAQRSGRNGTPLHAAAKWGNEEVKTWLLGHGADSNVRNEVGETPEEWGKRFEHDGPERVLRIRRAINRKTQAKKAEEEGKARMSRKVEAGV
ncbi:hypothetical protein P7C71_g3303, partial [Lecanoromycetidae sp. Uapishka_2]